MQRAFAGKAYRNVRYGLYPLWIDLYHNIAPYQHGKQQRYYLQCEIFRKETLQPVKYDGAYVVLCHF